MPNRIDTPGTYRGRITEMGLGTTKASGYPQAIVRVTAEKKWIEDDVELKHYELDEPAWQDWTDYNEEALGYLVLFNSTEVFSEDTSLMNYEQLQLALGWEGTEFESLNDGSYEGKEILFRMEEDEYNGKTSIKLNWVDRPDAPPGRELRRLDSEKVSELSAKLQIRKSPKPKKVAKPKKAAKAEKAESPESAESTSDESAAKPKTPSKKSKTSKAGPPPKQAKPEPDAEDDRADQADQADPADGDTEPESAIPDDLDEQGAWEYICSRKGDVADSTVEEAWIAACTEVLKDRDPDTATRKEWAKIVRVIVHDLALDE